jgi:hypothetical protein
MSGLAKPGPKSVVANDRTPNPALLSRTFQVGERTVTLTIPRPTKGRAVSVACEWSPDVPVRLSPMEWREYVAGRTAALAEVAAELGLHVAVIDA